MSQKKVVTDGFVRDENGKWNIVPFKHSASATSEKGKNSASAKKNQARKFIPIERLKLTPSGELEVSPRNETKRRKIEKPVRKELFKVPREKIRPSYIRQSKKFTASKISTSSLKTQYQLIDNSPLLDIEKAEELLTKNSLVLKPPESPEIVNHNINDNLLTKGVLELTRTPRSDESIKQFVQIEKALTMIETRNAESPMTSVCTLLQNAKINTKENEPRQKDDTVLNEIRTLMDKDRSEFELLKQQFRCYCENNEKTYNKINELLKQENNESDENKENRVRRSSRILEQVTISKAKTKFVVSPAISKKTDLRKSTLNKNLTKNLQFETQSPRTRKAVNLYNSFKTDYSILSTPKLDRSAINCAEPNSVTRSLSRRIQKQCLLLQDTPRQSEY